MKSPERIPKSGLVGEEEEEEVTPSGKRIMSKGRREGERERRGNDKTSNAARDDS